MELEPTPPCRRAFSPREPETYPDQVRHSPPLKNAIDKWDKEKKAQQREGIFRCRQALFVVEIILVISGLLALRQFAAD